MYSILQTKAKDCVLKNVIMDSPYISYENDIPAVNSTIGLLSLEFIIHDNKLKCEYMEMISQIFQIYGVDVWHANNQYYYVNLDNIYTVLALTIKMKHCVISFVNEWMFCYGYNRMLLSLLIDPLKTISYDFGKVPCDIKYLFDTLEHNIKQLTKIMALKYWLIWQVLVDGALVMDVINVILDKYIKILL